jgi:predicted DCC family thiol-disulfide oxidoreductase YuxK
MPAPAPASRANVVFYDGVCAMCNGLVRFILERDPEGRFCFAPLQSEAARQALRRHGRTAEDLDTMYLITDYRQSGERLFARSDAIVETLRRLGGIWGIFGWLRLLPASWRDFAYGLIVKNRYGTFGKFDACPLPPPEWRDRFLAYD